jgi:hypothetical protein
MNPFELNKNYSTIFLLPIMFPHITYEELIANYFEEAYIGTIEGGGEYDDTLLLKFNPNNFTEDLVDEVAELLNRDEYSLEYESENVFCYNIPESIKADYEAFLHGKYTQLQDEAKANILEFWEEDEDSLLHAILTGNAKNARAMELLKLYGMNDLLENFDNSLGEIWPPPNVLANEMMFEEF